MENSDTIDVTLKLDKHIWKTNHGGNKIDKWKDNFNSDNEKKLATYLLDRFVYFNNSMIREMLISLYRDIFEYQIRQDIIANGVVDIDKTFSKELQETRFLGLGKPAESGALLLYYFRQVNNVDVKLFIDGSKINYKDNVKRYIYIDDMSITGNQICDYATNDKYPVTPKKIKDKHSDKKINCYLLFATKDAIARIREKNVFDVVESVFELDESFKCFSDKSRYFSDNKTKNKCRKMAEKYGKTLNKDNILGYKNSQLLLGLEHNTPNNTLPIFWSEEKNWSPVFKRYGKKYGT